MYICHTDIYISASIHLYSPGTDPAADLYKFVEEMKFLKKLTAISLGQGQVQLYTMYVAIHDHHYASIIGAYS